MITFIRNLISSNIKNILFKLVYINLVNASSSEFQYREVFYTNHIVSKISDARRAPYKRSRTS